MAYGIIAIAGVAMLMLLAACSDGSQNADSISQGGIQRVSRSSGKVDGVLLMMAKELVASNVNPFLSKLPITADAQAEAEPPPPMDGQEQAAQPPVDPFEGLSLVGISYQPKNAYALLSLSSGGAAQVVREGDVLTTGNGAQIKIGKIKQTQVDVRETGSGSDRNLALPDIIGYTQSSSGMDVGGRSGQEGKGSGRSSRGKPTMGKGGGPEAALPAKDTASPPESTSPIIKLED